MRLVKATADDSDRLKSYFSENPLPGPMDLYIKRVGSFFDKYKLYSKDFVSYYLEDNNGQMQGMASLIFAPGYINGKEETLGFATDLRISNSRKAILNWPQHFLPVLEKERTERDCRFVFSTVARSQKQAMNAFLRPRSNRRQMPRYHLYRKFSVIGVHGRFPWAPDVMPGVHLTSATNVDLGRLYRFLTKDREGLQFPYLKSAEELEAQVDSWIGLNLSDLKILEDNNKNIVGSFALWNPTGVEEVFGSSFRGMVTTLHQGLRFFKWTGMTRPLGSPHERLKYKIVTHLKADNPDVFETIMNWIWRSTERDEFVIYPHYDGDLTHTPPRSFLTSQWRGGLFCLLSPSDPFPDFFYRSFAETPPYWELGFV